MKIKATDILTAISITKDIVTAVVEALHKDKPQEERQAICQHIHSKLDGDDCNATQEG